MFGILFRLFWRVIIFTAAILLAYATAFIAFPFLDQRIPVLPVLIILYLGLAYIAVPLLVRFWRLFIKANHIPVYVTTADGWPSDPVNIVLVVKNKRQLIKSMESAGWVAADRSTLKNLLLEGYAIIFNKPYPTAPMSSLYLFGRKQDIGFQIQEGDPPTPRHRHHVRFWQLRETTMIKGPHLAHHGFWHKVLARFIGREKEVWIGAATHDIGPFAIRWRSGQITHQIDKETNKERDFLIQTLKDSKDIKSITEVDSGEQLRFRGQTVGVNVVVDGCVKVAELKTSIFDQMTESWAEINPLSKDGRKD